MPENTDGTQGGAAVADGEASANDQWSSLVASATAEPTPAPDPATPTTGETVEPTGSQTPVAAGDGGKGEATPATSAVPETPKTAEAATAEAPKTDEPTVEAKPFEFVVDGQVRAMEGAAYVPGEGVFVPEAQVPALRRMAAQAVTLERQNRDLSTYKRDLDGLTEWKTTGADGKESVLTGRAGLEAQRVALGETTAALHAVAPYFRPDTDLREYLAQDADGRVFFSAAFLKQLKLEAGMAERDMRDAIRSQFNQRMGPTTKPEPAPAAPSIDWTQTGPVVVQRTAEVAGLDVAPLTPEDKTFLAGMVSRFARPATAADQELNPELKLGELVIDAAFTGVVQDRLALRQAAAKAVKAAETAAPFNAGMNKAPAAKPAAAPAPKAAPMKGAPKERTTKSPTDMWSALVDEAKTVVGAGRV